MSGDIPASMVAQEAVVVSPSSPPTAASASMVRKTSAPSLRTEGRPARLSIRAAERPLGAADIRGGEGAWTSGTAAPGAFLDDGALESPLRLLAASPPQVETGGAPKAPMLPSLVMRLTPATCFAVAAETPEDGGKATPRAPFRGQAPMDERRSGLGTPPPCPAAGPAAARPVAAACSTAAAGPWREKRGKLPPITRTGDPVWVPVWKSS